MRDRIVSVGGCSSTTAQMDPSHSFAARTGMTRRGLSSPSAGTKNGSLERASRRKTPRPRRLARTASGTLRPTMVDTRIGSAMSWREE